MRKIFALCKTNLIYKFIFKSIGSKSFLLKPMHITPEFIDIGQKVKIWHSARIEGVNSYANEIFSPQIFIDDGVEIQQRVHITCAGLLRIEKNTSIMSDVVITDITHGIEKVIFSSILTSI